MRSKYDYYNISMRAIKNSGYLVDQKRTAGSTPLPFRSSPTGDIHVQSSHVLEAKIGMFQDETCLAHN